MVIGRRSFLFSTAAFAAAPYLRTFADQSVPRCRIGVLSDIHVREPGWTLDPFVNALRWFDSMKVDGVVVAGDLADFGLVEQLAHVGAAWDAVFRGDRAADGRRVEKLFVTGNHDRHFHNHPWVKQRIPDEKERFARSMARDFNAAWVKCFHEEYRPVFRKDIGGFPFLARQYGEKGLADLIGREKHSLDPSRPFFVVQHQHPKGTCYGPDAWGHDDGKDSTAVLSAFPNAVAFSGHSHYSLTDERTVWQGSFTSVGTGSLCSIAAHYGYENGENPGLKRTEEMPMFVGGGKHGLLLNVYDDRLVLERRDFYPKSCPRLGPDWTIPLPFAEPAPFAFARRGRIFPVPEFPKGAKVSVRHADGPNRKKVIHPQAVIEFPAATSGSGRVFDYEVEVMSGAKKSLVRRVLSPTFSHLPEKDGGTVSCVFAASELPEGARIKVTPRNSYAGRGHDITTEHPD